MADNYGGKIMMDKAQRISHLRTEIQTIKERLADTSSDDAGVRFCEASGLPVADLNKEQFKQILIDKMEELLRLLSDQLRAS